MSIIIKGMGMPDNCYQCNLNYDSYRCRATGELFRDADLHYRHENCPLVELPPHGRLIDADEFAHQVWLNECEKCVISYCEDCTVGKVIEMIKQFPTIIEAEEDG